MIDVRRSSTDPVPQELGLLHYTPMLQAPQPQFFERSLRIRGVDVLLRVYPAESKFMFQTNREINETEKAFFAAYMQREGFLDNPFTGEQAENISL